MPRVEEPCRDALALGLASPGLTLLLLGGGPSLAGALAARCRPNGLVVWSPVQQAAGDAPAGVERLVSDRQALPLLSHSIDAAISIQLGDAGALGSSGAELGELRRVLAPQGRLLLTALFDAADEYLRLVGAEGFADAHASRIAEDAAVVILAHAP
jgi:hypothetical protein